MITHLRGKLSYRCPAYVVLEIGGVGYQVFISMYTYSRLGDNPEVMLLTHQVIKEDSHMLYGFSEEKERSLFRQLLSVNGVGPTTAQLLLSSISPDEVRAAILGEQEEVFRRARGVGSKTAKRIILDLKDKMVKESGEGMTVLPPAHNTMREEALSALVALGFPRAGVQKAVHHVLQESPPPMQVEDLIRRTLKVLSS